MRTEEMLPAHEVTRPGRENLHRTNQRAELLFCNRNQSTLNSTDGRYEREYRWEQQWRKRLGDSIVTDETASRKEKRCLDAGLLGGTNRKQHELTLIRPSANEQTQENESKKLSATQEKLDLSEIKREN
jgi:hypothetical protein